MVAFLSYFCMTIAFSMSVSGLLSIFEHPSISLAKLREAGFTMIRSTQILLLLSLLGLQWTLYAPFGVAPFHGFSLALYIVIFLEILALFYLNEWGLGFLEENLNFASVLKLVPVAQSIVVLVLIFGALGFGPAQSDFAVGGSAELVMNNEGMKIPAFRASWKKTSSMDSRPNTELEETFEVQANGDQFAIVAKKNLYQKTEIYTGQKWVEIHEVSGTPKDIIENEIIPVMIQRHKFWLRDVDLDLASDQKKPIDSTDRQVTLYERVEHLPSGQENTKREWVDDATGLVVVREKIMGQIHERLELVSLDLTSPEASAFDPAQY